MKVITNKKRIHEIFDRGVVVDVLPSREALLRQLYSGKRLKIYIGADPTSDSLHLSHAKNYMLLEELRQLGHEVIVLFGDFTAQIGDPTGRSDTRPQLTPEQVKENVKGWITQIKPLLNFTDKKNPARILYNGKWLSKLTLRDVIALGAQFTVQQMIERDMFQKRWDSNTPIYIHEFLYPLLQGYDSVAMDVDIELCGTDQIFNALAGRTLLKRLKEKEKFVIAVNLMANPKTGELMSKSRGTGIFLSLDAEQMFGAVMAQPDEMIDVLYINNTRLPLKDKKKVMSGGPRSAKEQVAFEIVKVFHGIKNAQEARHNFNRVFAKKELGDNLPLYKLNTTGRTSITAQALIFEIASEAKLAKSKSEAWRLGATLDPLGTNKKLQDPKEEMSFATLDEQVIKIGKRSYYRIRVVD